MVTHDRTIRLAAISDLHYGKASQGSLQPLFANISDSADILVICGDLTDYGRLEEAQQLAQELKTSVRVPIVAVLGNHDFQSA